jgi:SAM-dependent methyltransferase
MTQLRQILFSFYRRGNVRSVLRTLIPARFRPAVRRWFQPQADVQWCRVVMNREIERFIRSLDCSAIDTLEISGSGSQSRYDFRSYQTVSFPDYDVCEGPLASEKFDLIIAEQVFEHVLRPDLAATHVFQMLRPGGVFVVCTPFLVKVHEVPVDLYRWTQHGMRQLLETAGFSVLGSGSWGNLQCLMADMTPGQSWTSFDPQRHSLHNDPQFAIVVWAFAEKPKSREELVQ